MTIGTTDARLSS